jgi:hypothetical protein
MEKKSSLSRLVASFLLALALCMIAMPVLLTETVRGAGEATPYPLRGYVLNETDVPVVGASVVLSKVGSASTSTATTDSLGRYIVYGEEIPVGDNDVVRISATKAGIGSGHIAHVVNFTTTDPDYARNQNITLSPAELPSILEFNVTFFCEDESGVGVANATINVTNGAGDFFLLLSNSTGYAVITLPVGLYNFTAGTNISTLFNQTGDFRIIDRDLPVVIDFSRAPSTLHFMGLEMSNLCLVVIVVAVALALGLLFAGVVRRR